MKVSDIMTRRVRSVGPHHSLEAVMRIMWESDVGVVPVVNDDGQPIAMVTDRDVAVAAYTQGKPLGQIQVQVAMSRQLHTAHVSDTLGSAERTMRGQQVRRLPVVDESTRLVGIVSLADLARAHVSSPLARVAEHLLTDVASTLAIITRRRDTTDESDEGEPKERAVERGPAARELPPSLGGRALHGGSTRAARH